MHDPLPPPTAGARRRSLLVAAAAIVALLAACGGSTAEPSAVPAAVCAAGQIDGGLRLHLPGAILPPEAVPDFEVRYGVAVELSTYETTDELIAQVEARVAPYDLIIPGDDVIRLMREADLLIPLSEVAIPQADNLMAMFGDPPYDPDSVHSVPFTWGTIGLGVNINVAGGIVPSSWGLVFDPDLSDRFAGRISLMDDARLALGAALKYLGYSLNTDDPDEIDAAADLIAGTRERLAGFSGEEGEQELVDGETDVAQGASGAFFDVFQSASAWDDYTYIVPQEGAAVTVQAMAVPVTAEHPCTAHTFIDFLLDPERGEELARWNRAASPNAAALQLVDPALAGDAGLYPPPETMANLEFVTRSLDAAARYVDAFERTKR